MEFNSSAVKVLKTLYREEYKTTKEMIDETKLSSTTVKKILKYLEEVGLLFSGPNWTREESQGKRGYGPEYPFVFKITKEGIALLELEKEKNKLLKK